MSDKTPVEFTQAGKRITFSAGYIIAIAPFKFNGRNWAGDNVELKCAVCTQLGVVFVDQDFHEAGLRLNKAMTEPEDYTTRLQRALSTTALGNEAEF